MGKTVTRIQLIKLKDGTPESERKELEKALRQASDEIPTVSRCSIGENINPMYPGAPAYTMIWHTEHENIRGLQVFNTHLYHREVVWPYLNPDDPRCIAERHLTVVYEWE